MLRDDIVNYLTVGSVLQMWHIVDKCTELLKESRAAGTGGGSRENTDPESDGIKGGQESTNPGCSSSNGDGRPVPEGESAALAQGPSGSIELQRAPSSSHPSVNESQSPSSTNYFSPRDGNSFGGNTAAAGASGDGAGSSDTPSYCNPSGGEETFLIEEDEEEEEEELLYHQRKRGRIGGSARRKKTSSISEQEVGVSDSFGVSSYQVIICKILHHNKVKF